MRLGLVQIPIALNENNRDEIFWMCASVHMTIYAIEMTKLEVSGNLVTLQRGSFNCSERMISYQSMKLNKVPFIHKVS